MKSVVEITEFDKVKEYAGEHAITELGRKKMLNCQIFDDIEIINKQLILTTEARKLYDLNLKIPLENFSDLTNSFIDAKKKIKLSEQEIWSIGDFLRISRLVKNFLDLNQSIVPNLFEISNQLFVMKSLEDKIFETFDNSLNVKENASFELKRLYREQENITTAIKSTVAKLLTNTEFTENL
ncbi:hypothetical protein IJG14_01020, partial [bacterium]|nr:hypothetical protein [bacterium]